MSTDDLAAQVQGLRLELDTLKRQYEFESAMKRSDDQEVSSLRDLVLQLRDLVMDRAADGDAPVARGDRPAPAPTSDDVMDRLILQKLVMQDSTLRLIETNQRRILSTLERQASVTAHAH